MEDSRTTEDIAALLALLKSRGVARFSHAGLSVEFWSPAELASGRAQSLLYEPAPTDAMEPAPAPTPEGEGGATTPPEPTDDMGEGPPPSAVYPRPNPFAGMRRDDPLFDSAGKGV